MLLVERTGHVGGTTAWSAGTTWVPGTHHAARVNPSDTLADAARYLTNAIGDRTPAALREAFLDHGAAAIRQLEDRTELKFRPYPKHPDYISDLGGSTLNGRALEPLPFDGRLLGDLFKLVRPPIPEFTVLGGMMVDRTDINHLLALTKSFASFKHSLKIIARHGMDRLSHPRGTRLVMGNALVARLLYSLSKQAGVTLALNISVERFERDGAGVTGMVLKGQGAGAGGNRNVTARGGVVLASGGFNRHPDLREQLLPGANMPPGAPQHPAILPRQMHDMAKDVWVHVWGTGGASEQRLLGTGIPEDAVPDGSQAAVFPHFVMDRAKPGMLTVNAER